jgi:uncharacterized protein DUF1592/uncharacterized protein DUF1588/uncharacterized protein DUF1587/uncharacterized protein DUF1595/uncharacterized protein DUF1585
MLSRRSPSWCSFGTLLISILVGCTAETQDNKSASSAAGSIPAGPGQPGAGGNGTSPAAGGGSTTPDVTCSSASPDVGSSILRRLSGLEYQLTLQDLFQLQTPPSLEGLPADTEKDGFKVFAEVQTVSAQHLRSYLAKAQELGTALMADSARRTRVLGCEPSANGCLKQFITRFGRLAYRRALSAEEIDALVTRAERDALDVNDRFQFALEVMLTAPDFLYRAEVGATPEGLSTLSPAELAAKLSFAVWGRAPSAELLDQAEQGALDTSEGISQTVDRLLADQRVQGFYSGFFRQWLGYEAVRAPTTSVKGWSDALLPAMQAETDTVLKEFAWGGLNFLDALTTNRTYLKPELATFYGLPAPGADGLLTIPGSHVRANTGLLTHASLLGAKSDGDLIALRGDWLRETFLCRHMQVPASVAEQLGELLVGLTRVQIVKERNSRAECKGCHSVIDPIGVGLAQFDRAGRYDESLDISEFGIAPALPDAPSPAFASVEELAAKLRAMPEVSACLTSRAFLYVNGREPAASDRCTTQTAEQNFAAESSSFPTLLRGLVTASSFRLRRSE